SDVIDMETLNNATLVVTLCGDAADKCPMTPPQVHREHWGFEDPARVKGTEQEKWQVFQEVRDAIGARIEQFVEELD
ncbi:MAG TPA: arsenate reductase, partial [Rummeliibacillus sp.]|nr:arsenate reductase [Rummeliibacillus sp.]